MRGRGKGKAEGGYLPQRMEEGFYNTAIEFLTTLLDFYHKAHKVVSQKTQGVALTDAFQSDPWQSAKLIDGVT